MVKVNDTGFTCLGPAEKPSYRFNVIFVHGLLGHPKRTWGRGSDDVAQDEDITSSNHRSFRSFFRWSQQTSGSKSPQDAEGLSLTKPFWPAEFLLEDIPEARVWTYGYNANVVEGVFQASSQNSVSQHGGDLAVKFERVIDNQEPVIFVAHSLGGIVVKEAIRVSKICRSRTKLIIFLGTPHRGSQYAPWGTIACRLANCALQDTDMNIVRALKVNSEVLNIIHQGFISAIPESGIKIHSFQEGRGFKGVRGLHGKVVDDFSSKFDLPPAIETVETIDANHSQMTKFADKSDAGYCDISGVLKGFIRSNLGAGISRSVGIGERADATSKPDVTQGGPPFFHVPFSVNRQFVGRTEILETLQDKLFGSDEIQQVALAGLGGIGKSQIAIEIAFWAKKHKPDYSVFWVPALSDATIEQACAEIMQVCRIQQNEREIPRKSVREYLSSPNAGKWLLIIDNADDMDVVFPSAVGGQHGSNWLPTCGQGRILFTTRSPKLAFTATSCPSDVVKLSQMNLAEGTSYLEKSLRQQDLLQDKQAVADLLGALTYLPLAIKQATSYMNENELTIMEYLDLFHNTDGSQVELLSSEFPDRTRYEQSEQSKNAVATTWLISFNQIRKVNEPAATLLSFMAFIEPRAIPHSMLPKPNTKQQMTASIGILCGYGFLNKYADGQMFEMHRVVHFSTRIWVQKEDRRDKTLQHVTTHLESIFPDRDWENRDLWQQYLPHALVILRQSNEKLIRDYPYRLANRVGTCLKRDGRFTEAIQILEQAIKTGETTFARHDRWPIWCQIALADAYRKNGQSQDAMNLLEPVVSMLQKTRGEDDEDLLGVQATLSSAYGGAGKIKDAIQLLQHVVKRRDAILAEQDERRLFSRHELALLYWKNNQIEESFQLFKQVVAVRKRYLVEDDPDRLTSQHMLASAYLDKGMPLEAIKLLKHVVAMRAKTLPKYHPSRLTSEHELARAYLNSGNVDEAIEGLKHVVAIRQKTLPEHHLDRLTSEHELARAYLHSGNTDEGIERLGMIVAKEKEVLTEDHPTRLLSETLLAQAYLYKYRTQEAIELLKHVVAIHQGVLGEDHGDRLWSEALLANAYLSCGQVETAIQLYKHVISVRTRISASDDPQLLDNMKNLARAYEANGQIEDAIQLLEKVVDIRVTSLKKDDPNLLMSQHTLGLKYMKTGQLTKAIELLERVVEVKTGTLDDGDSTLLVSQYCLGQAYLDGGRAQEAIQTLEKVVEVEASALDGNDDGRLMSQQLLGRAYLAGTRLKEAIDILERVVSIRTRVLPRNDPTALKSCEILSEAYEANGQLDKANELRGRIKDLN
ncbi:kinesin light chain [Fusarium albosuccineum]|uniref:Kinesin light chain n=1 Tax=Fusarium albosuccineum TaxID=1237068 RepID=A0A8H4L4H0_9HYPO|nr:kinesin light chain [Fusarium albosuccineum]